MNKTIALLVAVVLVANSFQAIAGCLIETGTPAKCYLCANGKKPAADSLTCVDIISTDFCLIGHNSAANNIKICDLCAKDKSPMIDGTCGAKPTTPTAGLDASCGLGVAKDATDWTCLGCASTTTNVYTKISAGTCVTTALVLGTPVANTAEIAITSATSGTCPVNYARTDTAASCLDYGTDVSKRTADTAGKDLQSWDSNGATAAGAGWYYSSDKTIETTTWTAVTAISGCWLSLDTTICTKCRGGFVATYLVHTAAPWLKVTCAAWTAPTGTLKACRAGWNNGTALCHTCADINGTLSAPNVNYSCDAAANTTTNNTTTTTSSSILSLTFAAFFMFIINRLF